MTMTSYWSRNDCALIIMELPDTRGACLCHLDVDVDRHAFGEDVEHRGARARLPDDLTQLLVRRVALDREAGADGVEAVADFARQAEDAAQIHVAFDEGGHL